ncbi:DUF6483 family protein [Butyrivibrio sp. INlla16]|uniref:DUF6483 family protein n=1 Tax=Butyrivibrio sp. INlla16 TaxID=1520807 RepID=UPI000887EC09|nr:DUF6483 family protein [Butyrivibrio sp. INlla16]SDB68509.1 hypothetical protein SAMN02910263_04216 [Butyrivibrio sp. INlla16]
MTFDDEKDYIMRIIKEVARVLFSLMLGKKYVAVEMEKDNGYEVSGKKLEDFLMMIDQGMINEAENQLLDNIDYSDKENVAAAVLFYQYLSEKSESFLTEHDFSKGEVLDGMNRLVQKAGYGDLLNIVEGLQVL